MNRQAMVFLCLIASIIFLIISCSKTSEDKLAPPASTCDTVNMTYLNDVAPILQANCYSCHATGNTISGIPLDNYEAVKNMADNGFLIGTITHTAGYVPMPENLPKLSDCDINIIQDWVNRGASNN